MLDKIGQNTISGASKNLEPSIQQTATSQRGSLAGRVVEFVGSVTEKVKTIPASVLANKATAQALSQAIRQADMLGAGTGAKSAIHKQITQAVRAEFPNQVFATSSFRAALAEITQAALTEISQNTLSQLPRTEPDLPASRAQESEKATRSPEQFASAFAKGEALSAHDLVLAQQGFESQLAELYNTQSELVQAARLPGGASEIRSRQYDTTKLSPDFARMALTRSAIGQEEDFANLTQRNAEVRELNEQIKAGVVDGELRVEIKPLAMQMSRGAEVLASRIDALVVQAAGRRAEQLEEVSDDQIAAIVQSEFRNVSNYKTGVPLLDQYILAQLPDILTDAEREVLADYDIKQRALGDEIEKLEQQLNDLSVALADQMQAE